NGFQHRAGDCGIALQQAVTYRLAVPLDQRYPDHRHLPPPCLTSVAAERPASAPSTVAINRPLPVRYPSRPRPESPQAAPPPASRLGRRLPSGRSTRASTSTFRPPWV